MLVSISRRGCKSSAYRCVVIFLELTGAPYRQEVVIQLPHQELVLEPGDAGKNPGVGVEGEPFGVVIRGHIENKARQLSSLSIFSVPVDSDLAAVIAGYAISLTLAREHH